MLGASQAEAAISMDVGLATARLGEVETLEYQRDRGMGVTVYFGTRKGTASTGDLGAAALARPSPRPADRAASRPRIPAPGCPTRRTWRGGAGPRPLASLGHLAGTRLRDGDRLRSGGDGLRPARITNSEGARCRTHRGCASTAIRWASSPAIPAPCTASAARCSAARASRCSATTGTARCATGANWNRRRRGPTRARARHCPARRAQAGDAAGAGAVLARARAGTDRPLLGAIRGGSQYRRSSFLLDAAGQQVFPDWFALSERPHLREGAGERAVRQRRRRDARSRLVTAACCTATCSSTYSARKLGLHHRQCRRRAQPDRARARQRVSTACSCCMGRGLVVTELMGQGSMP